MLPSTDEDTWFAAWRGMPEEERPVMRSYTVREQRRTTDGGPGRHRLRPARTPARRPAGPDRPWPAAGSWRSDRPSRRTSPYASSRRPTPTRSAWMYAERPPCRPPPAIRTGCPPGRASGPGFRSRTRG
ncbi:siderophore-interacting protein [Streptomyces avidinii]